MFGLLLLGFFLGVLFVLVVAYTLLLNPFAANASHRFILDQYPPFQIPNELKQLLINPGSDDQLIKHESCIGINLLTNFLYQEYKDTRWFRRWALKKMQMEFNDLTWRTTVGRLIQDVKIRDLTVGTQFPVIKSMTMDRAQLSENNDSFEELDLILDIEYQGGMTASVDVSGILGSFASLSVKVCRVAGQARLRLTRLPYTHWSFSFVDTPIMNFQIDSHFQGKPSKHLAPLIIQQFRRAIQRRHVLPNFKVRYRPLFPNPLLQPSVSIEHFDHMEVSGGLEVTILSSSRLNTECAPLGWTEVYCTVKLASRPFFCGDRSSMHFITMTMKMVRYAGSEDVGFVLNRTIIPEIGGENSRVVYVEHLSADSAALRAGFHVGDVILTVNGMSVRNERHAKKLIDGTVGELTVIVQRNLDDVDGDDDDVVAKLVGNAVNVDADDEDDFIQVDLGAIRDEDVSTLLRKAISEIGIPISMRSNDGGGNDDDSCHLPLDFYLRKTRSEIFSSVDTNFNSMDKNDEQFGGNKEPAEGMKDGNEPGDHEIIEPIKPESGQTSGGFLTKKERFTAKATEMAQKLQYGKATVRELWNKHSKRFEIGTAELGIEAEIEAENESQSEIMAEKASEIQVLDEKTFPACGKSVKHGNNNEENNIAEEQMCFNMKSTKGVELNENVLWGQSLHFPLEISTNRYLNITVWARIPKSESNSIVLEQTCNDNGNDLLSPVMLGYTSMFIPELLDDCSVTLSNFHCETFTLRPPGQVNVPSKYRKLEHHPGFDGRLCYGDLTVGFRYFPDGLPRNSSVQLNSDGDEERFGMDDRNTSAFSDVESRKHHWISIHVKQGVLCVLCRGKVLEASGVGSCENQAIRSVGSENADIQPRRRRIQQKVTEKLANWRSFRKKSKEHIMDVANACQEVEKSAASLQLFDVLSLKNSLEDLPSLLNSPLTQLLYTPEGNYNEVIIHSAKDLGKELFSDLSLNQRKVKIDQQIDIIQTEINETTERRLFVMNAMKNKVKSGQKTDLADEYKRLDERLQAFAVLMLYYCSGLQNCADLEEIQHDCAP